ncbi:hypothetical protein BAUCODRAFT_31532 [Baudoinia panamericana UAMH 10762]|uniref:FAD-binding domain-containing protein n=1 Tax=Baudoinia panamericana (strain UAMH 10762) TaxID=717646 RepID=M2N598_BAUPA|nr:uncharacterized protein BAUCODRAFT_31532 [Baudoinia panamericana UAMH 10762]EMC99198.1 hypothetical protein BAUCODRAFT_31532 [Baudoinia panamericana UAMH 10762]
MAIKVAIIGAGPAGCMLARLLHHKQPATTPLDQKVSVMIFEGEESLDFRSQGGTLDLHVKTGQLALREAGLWEEFQKYARYDGEAIKLADKNFVCYVNMGGAKPSSTSSTGRPEIDRPVLRKMLADSLPPNCIRWGKKLTKVDDDLTLHFADGTVEPRFDLVVGADGAWSRVRPLVTDVKPYFSGIGGHSFIIPDAQNSVPELYKAVNRGSLFSWSDGKGIFAQFMGEGCINVATWSLRPADWQKTCGYDVHDAAAVKEACRKDYADWNHTLREFTQIGEDNVVPRDLFMLPIGHKWKHVPGVTLIGDAAHLMTPFAGEGVNLAFADTLDLSRAILSAASLLETDSISELLDSNVQAFEVEMFVRSAKTQQTTYNSLQMMFLTPGSPRFGIEGYLLNILKDEIGLGIWIATPLVYAWFFIFRLIW